MTVQDTSLSNVLVDILFTGLQTWLLYVLLLVPVWYIIRVVIKDFVKVYRRACSDTITNTAPTPILRPTLASSTSVSEYTPDKDAVVTTGEFKQPLCSTALSIIVYGASGDLARKKTFPALFNLFCRGLVPRHACIIGYARTAYSEEEFRGRVRDSIKSSITPAKAQLQAQFLSKCHYISGGYDDIESYMRLNDMLMELESGCGKLLPANRMFYFAVPPSAYDVIAKYMVPHVTTSVGWVRCVLEKPFGKDLETSRTLMHNLHSVLQENQLYRIDHYLGKEMVQNLLVVRFGNRIFSPTWNRDHIANVVITFKEPFGIENRAGYFDEMGIIRDVLQNHLLQMLCLVAMERPMSMNSEHVRDCKVNILKHITPLRREDIVIGQYIADNEGHKGYRDEKDVRPETPTYACAVFHINTERWDGVPFIIKCGKALNERKSEVRIQYKPLPYDLFGMEGHRNELVCRVQPNEAMYTKIITKKPGLQQNGALITELDLTYNERFSIPLPDAYESLIFDVLRGERGTFVRGDELDVAWQLLTPVLHEMETSRSQPIPYKYGTRGPKEADDLVAKYGWKFQPGYKWGKNSYQGELSAQYKEVADGDICKDFNNLM